MSTRTLDWISRHDPRSLDFPVRSLIGAAVKRRKRTWRVGQILDQGKEGACFTGDVLIRLADGSQREIQDVRVLDRVLTAEGNVGTVLKVMARRHDGPLVRVIAWGHSHLRCTPEHPILTRRGYVPASELVADDWIAMPRFTPPDAPTVLYTRVVADQTDLRGMKDGAVTVHGLLSTTTVSTVSGLPPSIPLSPDFGRLIGLYAAEGHQTANKVVWSYGSHESETLVPETVRLIRDVLGAEARVQVRSGGSAVNVVLYGKHWRLLFAGLVPGTSKYGDKHLSHHVTNSPPEFLRGLFDGWYDGDGHIRRRLDHEARDGITVSRRLATDMLAIGVALGYRAGIHGSEPSANAHATTRQYRWNVSFAARPEREPGDGIPPTECQCGCGGKVEQKRRYRTTRFMSSHSSGFRSEMDDQYLWRRVRHLEVEPFEGEWVFNLEVEGDHSYVADGVGVHNCVPHGWIGEALATPVRVDFTRVNLPFGWSRDPQALAFQMYNWCRQNDEFPGDDTQGTSVLQGAKGMQLVGTLKSYRWALGLDDVVDTVVAYGPVIIGIPWYDGMYQAPGGEVTVAGQVVGGHCLAVVGYDPARVFADGSVHEALQLLNSWGSDWGINGLGWIKSADLGRLLQDGGEACVPVGRSYARARLTVLARRVTEAFRQA